MQEATFKYRHYRTIWPLSLPYSIQFCKWGIPVKLKLFEDYTWRLLLFEDFSWRLCFTDFKIDHTCLSCNFTWQRVLEISVLALNTRTCTLTSPSLLPSSLPSLMPFSWTIFQQTHLNTKENRTLCCVFVFDLQTFFCTIPMNKWTIDRWIHTNHNLRCLLWIMSLHSSTCTSQEPFIYFSRLPNCYLQ